MRVSNSYLEPVILYTLVAGRSGTNKAGSLVLVKTLIEKLKTDKKQKSFVLSQFRCLQDTLD